MNAEVLVAIIRMTGGNFRLLTQIERVFDLNES